MTEKRRQYLKNYYKTNRPRLNTYARQYRANNPEKVKKWNDRYGISHLAKLGLITDEQKQAMLAEVEQKHSTEG